MDPELPLIVLKELAGNDAPSLNAIQHAFLPHLGGLMNMWWAIWFLTLIVVIRYVWVNGTRKDP